jgi:gamma-butyrobetaine dioxygenase
VPRHAAGAIARDAAALRDWIRDTVVWGLTIVEGVATEPGAGLALARRIGFLRKTNFGEDFDVVSKPDPNNLAYTSLALPLHTDLANQELPPGYQFLHCIANEAAGGGSVFADGVAMAEALRERDPAAFDMLARIPVPFRFHDADYDIRVHRPVINLTHGGRGSRDQMERPPGRDLRHARRGDGGLLSRLSRFHGADTGRGLPPDGSSSPAGEMVVFDNRRVLHGRDAFDPSTGRRHLQGCYVDRGEMLSRLRVLSR